MAQPPAARFSALATGMLLLALSIGLLHTGGCSEEGIRAYEVPKAAPVPEAAKSAAAAKTARTAPDTGARLLAAIVPRHGEVWHFKLMGPAPLVNPIFDSFVGFVESIKFVRKSTDEGQTTEAQWKLPAGWIHRPGTGMRYATIIIGESAHGIELTIFRFGPESGDVLANVQRWAGQIGVTGVTDRKLADMTRPIVVDDQPATLVDVSGPGAEGDPSMTPVAPPARAERLVSAPPPGFVADPNPSQFLIAKYDITVDGKTAALTVSSAGGSPVANLNRWRGQVGLGEWDQEGILKALEDKKELDEAEINGRGYLLVDVIGPESLGDKRERIIGALTPGNGGQAWFIKFHGPADLIAGQKDAFDAFMKSIGFE